jgi:hypothetical protein
MGPKTEFIDHATQEIRRLHFVLEHPPTVDIIGVGSARHLIASDKIIQQLSGLSGLETRKSSGISLFARRPLVVTLDEQWWVSYQGVEVDLDAYTWLVIRGQAFKDDFGTYMNCTIISQHAVDVLATHRLGSAEVKAASDFNFDPAERKRLLTRKSLEGLKSRGLPLPAKFKSDFPELYDS